MCPACLTSLAVTVLSTVGVGATATAFIARLTRSTKADPEQKESSVEERDEPEPSRDA